MALELPSGQQAACPNARKPGGIVSPRTRSLRFLRDIYIVSWQVRAAAFGLGHRMVQDVDLTLESEMVPGGKVRQQRSLELFQGCQCAQDSLS